MALMPEVRYVHGPPGTGKSRLLVDLYILAVENYGSDRVALVTYTKAAAEEVKGRVAAHFNVPANSFPYVSTIHAACYRLLGSPSLVDGRRGRFKEFVKMVGFVDQITGVTESDPQSLNPYWYSEMTALDEATVFRRVYAQEKHEMQAVAMPAEMTRPRFEYLAQLYDNWKREERLLDFEDLLVQGADLDLPVKVLLVDEVQDNSALMWHVVERWAENLVFFCAAGDPWQAIYQFVGANPGLFIERIESGRGRLISLGDSHRLTQQSAQYAQNLLLAGGWAGKAHDLLSSWGGVQQDGSDDQAGNVFYLARTHNLLSSVKSQLEDAGTPYADLKGYSILSGPDGRAFRTLMRIREGDAVSPQELKHVLERSNTPRGGIQALQYATSLSAQEVVELIGEDLTRVGDRIGHSYYLDRVYRKYGLRGLIEPPKTLVGTIHSAKGRESRETHLITSWATLPARALATPAGRRAESCVAYVAASRHRGTLDLIHGAFGTPYPF